MPSIRISSLSEPISHDKWRPRRCLPGFLRPERNIPQSFNLWPVCALVTGPLQTAATVDLWCAGRRPMTTARRGGRSVDRLRQRLNRRNTIYVFLFEFSFLLKGFTPFRSVNDETERVVKQRPANHGTVQPSGSIEKTVLTQINRALKFK